MDARAAPAGDASVVVAAPAVALRTAVGLRRGAGDPTWHATPDGVWHGRPTPDGPATLRLRARPDGVEAHAWGPGARAALADVPGLLGRLDDVTGFAAHLHPAVHAAARAHPDLRLPRSGEVWPTLVTAVLEQRVVGLDAHASWRRLVLRHGEPAPGPAPAGLRVCPAPGVWASLPVWEWRGAGVDAQRSGAVQRAAVVAHRFTADLEPDELARRVRTVVGIGPWTAAETTARALGDPDAVQVGDAHLPHLVGWALTGRRADDAGMLHLLAPWAGHRQRVVVLLERAYRGRMPTYGPRAARARPMR
ncbi:DNA-3-methyladenine glycosylase family protein [Cellulomonas oligotrophica]|uniref:3-methyladenine DNA glycosylase n=1 Tax=Cellulomonas oligotrophica TaxID=931536 RepID=A0A7Y9FKT1_9CELL|nr:DNA-3-methyladenine glycosylase 2 family protein [Cellulomonas oligotrophica]NYD87901.1 3-methyladenine DNA glycosylase/8-oxoguanine DNA glycosylase [Cellulomonas oligotrophica]GIG32892.1 3-methyladenine DNA glycosylase [Cellulomonas oligotrophica]